MSEVKTTHIEEVRQLMLEQLRALRTASAGEALAQELKRSKGVSELSATIIDSARVEVEYLRVIQGDGEVPFLTAPDAGAAPVLPKPDSGQPWPTSVVHRLKG